MVHLLLGDPLLAVGIHVVEVSNFRKQNMALSWSVHKVAVHVGLQVLGAHQPEPGTKRLGPNYANLKTP